MENLLTFNLQSFIQAIALISTVLVGFGAMRAEVKGQGVHLDKLDTKVDKLETAFIQLARQDERLAAMDQRMLAEGKRIDRIADQVYKYRRAAETQEG